MLHFDSATMYTLEQVTEYAKKPIFSIKGDTLKVKKSLFDGTYRLVVKHFKGGSSLIGVSFWTWKDDSPINAFSKKIINELDKGSIYE